MFRKAEVLLPPGWPRNEEENDRPRLPIPIGWIWIALIILSWSPIIAVILIFF